MSNKPKQKQEIDSTYSYTLDSTFTISDTLDSTLTISDPFESSLEDNRAQISLILSYDENNNELKAFDSKASLITNCSISSSNDSRNKSCNEESNNSYSSFQPETTSTQQTNGLSDTSIQLFPCNFCFNCENCLEGYRDFISAINVSATSSKSGHVELDDTDNRLMFKELFDCESSQNITENSLNNT